MPQRSIPLSAMLGRPDNLAKCYQNQHVSEPLSSRGGQAKSPTPLRTNNSPLGKTHVRNARSGSRPRRRNGSNPSRMSSTATAPSARISCSTRRSAPPARAERTCRSARPLATSTPSRPTSSRRSRATSTSSGGSARSTAGTRWRRWCGGTRCRASTAGTSPPSPRRRCSTTSGSTTSGGRGTTSTAATWCSSRATRSPASTPGRSWRGGSARRLLDNFRSETGGEGLSSYPHPWLMPDYWQFPTVSMGLGPLMAIYQARFMKYMHNRGLIDMADRKVWAFLGDGEMDEPESLGAIGLAAREGLDNLIFVVNCNLQRLDGPVRGNGKIIQELEGTFRGAGWDVIKLIWGSGWDKLLEKDDSGKLRQLMDETVDGDYQTFKSRDGAYIREHFFGKYPETAKLVEDWTDAEIWALRRGGHDPHKVYAAFDRAVKTEGQPTVLLVKTVKGYGMGDAGEGQNITHQQKKLAEDQLKAFRDRFDIPVPEGEVAKAPYVTLGNEQKDYILKRRDALGGPFPVRRHDNDAARDPGPVAVRRAAEGHRRPADLDDDGLRPGAERALPRQEDRQVRRADRAGREPHLRHGGDVPPARHLQPEGPALHAAGRRPAQLLQGEQGRPGAAGGHQRGRRDGRLDRRGDRLLGARRADDPLLHLLLDVRLPAGRRPRLGGRRQPGARLPARRHRRADHAERRGAAARGRAQPHPRRHDPELHHLRSGVRLRGRGHRAGRPPADVRRPGGRLLLPDGLQRELPPSGDAGGRREGDRQGALPLLEDREARATSTST